MFPLCLNNTPWPISEHPASHVKSIKPKYLCVAHRKHLYRVHLWMASGKLEINTFPTESAWNQNFTPSPFSIKEAWILTWRRWSFETLVYHLLGLLAFRIKSLFLVPTTHLLIYWSAVGSSLIRCKWKINNKPRMVIIFSIWEGCTGLFNLDGYAIFKVRQSFHRCHILFYAFLYT